MGALLWTNVKPTHHYQQELIIGKGLLKLGMEFRNGRWIPQLDGKEEVRVSSSKQIEEAQQTLYNWVNSQLHLTLQAVEKDNQDPLKIPAYQPGKFKNSTRWREKGDEKWIREFPLVTLVIFKNAGYYNCLLNGEMIYDIYSTNWEDLRGKAYARLITLIFLARKDMGVN